MVGRAGAGRRLRPGLRRGGRPRRRRLGGVLALHAARQVRPATGEPVPAFPQGAGVHPAVPLADRRPGGHAGRHMRVPRRPAGDHRPRAPAERDRPPGAVAVPPGRRQAAAGRRQGRPAPARIREHGAHRAAGALPSAERGPPPAPDLGAAAGVAAALRGRHPAAGTAYRGLFRGLVAAPGAFRRAGGRPADRAAPGPQRPAALVRPSSAGPRQAGPRSSVRSSCAPSGLVIS